MNIDQINLSWTNHILWKCLYEKSFDTDIMKRMGHIYAIIYIVCFVAKRDYIIFILCNPIIEHISSSSTPPFVPPLLWAPQSWCLTGGWYTNNPSPSYLSPVFAGNRPSTADPAPDKLWWLWHEMQWRWARHLLHGRCRIDSGTDRSRWWLRPREPVQILSMP